MSSIHITVLGSGTSAGVPTIGCSCEVCRSTDPRDNRLRPSILIRYDGRTVLIDTTPDFREQALRARIERIDAIRTPITSSGWTTSGRSTIASAPPFRSTE